MPPLRSALVVTCAFFIVGLCWVLFTDEVLYELIRDPILIARIETAKGWSFVLGSALLILFLTYRIAKRLSDARAALSAIIRCIGDGLLVLGRERTIVYANPAALKMLDCEDAGMLVGMGPQEFSRRFC